MELVSEARTADPGLAGAQAPVPPHRERGFGSRARSVRGLSERTLVPAAGTVAVAAMAREPLEGAVLALLTFVCAAFVLPARPPWSALLPLMRAPLQLLLPTLGVAVLAVVQVATGLPGLRVGQFAIVFAATALAALLPYAEARRAWRSRGRVRIGLIGSARAADDLARELRLARIPDYEVAGRVAVAERAAGEGDEVPLLGALGELGRLVERHDIQLLVMSSAVPRAEVFEEISRSCLHLPVRLWELSGFYEEVFGHVPVAQINAAWFQYIIHPKFRAVAPTSKRALDLLVAVPVALAFLPLLALLALVIRRDGGPVFFRQVRIGEGGRPIRLLKLRTMRSEGPIAAEWASENDPRVTRIGRLLRASHLDEMPQILNVIRGEMSLVGPRPEQPEFVQRLEEVLPFYERRRLLKPGLTGWAQVRCGYAGSDIGSAWKLSHDLYYLKHRSMAFDIAILCETVRTLFADRRYAIEPKWVPFIHGYDPLPPVHSMPVSAAGSSS